MFEITLPGDSNEPLYLQIYMHFRELIRSQHLHDGVQIPSIRALSLQLHISKITIETAYQMLLTEGYIISKPRSGYYVFNPPLQQLSPVNQDMPEPNRNVSFLTMNRDQLTNKQVAIDFHPPAVDAESFPARIWKRLLSDVLLQHNSYIHHYGDPQGEYGFRVALAQYLNQSRGVMCLPEQIVIGSGMTYSIQVLSKLLEGTRAIAFEEPGYAPAREAFRDNRFTIIPIPVHTNGLSISDLVNSTVQAVYVTPSHQFPTGCTLPYSARERLLQWAHQHDAYIIEDDYDGEFNYMGKPIPSIHGLGQHDKVVYIGTFSKVFSAAIRMNYMVLPMELTHKLQSMTQILNGPSRIEQLAMLSFIEKGHWYRHIRRMRNVYRKKHQTFIRLIHTHFAHHIQMNGQQAGLHLEVTVNCSCSVDQLITLAAAEGVRVYGFQNMWMGTIKTGKPRIYLGFGGVSITEMELGITLLRKAWAGVLC
jgi:GntR family transcriptional regulator/MocR family aminotransferase